MLVSCSHLVGEDHAPLAFDDCTCFASNSGLDQRAIQRRMTVMFVESELEKHEIIWRSVVAFVVRRRMQAALVDFLSVGEAYHTSSALCVQDIHATRLAASAPCEIIVEDARSRCVELDDACILGNWLLTEKCSGDKFE